MQFAKCQLADGQIRTGRIENTTFIPFGLETTGFDSLADLLEAEDPAAAAADLPTESRWSMNDVSLLAPIDSQEVWAAGVTYRRSQVARMDESEASASCYDLVYNSPRPELFFKATANRVVGSGQPVRIRVDSKWNVPEPELALVLNSRAEIVGYTVGNDVSSRDIEGENPLYLPQAKMYNACCGLGPWITLASAMPRPDQVDVRLVVRRGGQTIFSGATNTKEMARSFDSLIEYLIRDNQLVSGAFLLTGTGIIPDNDFTLQPADEIEIEIEGIGTLLNSVVQGE